MEERTDFAFRTEKNGGRKLVAPGKTRVSSSWMAKVPARNLCCAGGKMGGGGGRQRGWKSRGVGTREGGGVGVYVLIRRNGD